MAEYTAELVRPDGTVVDREAFNVIFGESDFNISTVDSPNRACPGDSARLTVNVDNDGECGGSGRIILSNDANENVLESVNSIRSNSSTSFRLQPTIPSNVTGAVNYTAQIEDVNKGEVVDTETFDISVGSTSISITNTDFPDSLCVGGSEDWSLEAKNNGECEASVSLGIKESNSDQFDIISASSARADSTARFRESISVSESDVDEDTKSYDIAVFVRTDEGLEQVDSTSESLNVQNSDISVTGVTLPSQRCINSGISGGFVIDNAGQCSAEYRVLLYDDISESETTIKREEIRGNTRNTATFKDEMPPEALESGSVNYKYTVQVLQPDGFVTVDTGSASIDVITSEVSISEVSSTDSACVGSNISPTIVLDNQSQCDGEYRVILDKPLRPGTDVIASDVLPSNSNKNITISDTVPVEAVGSDTIQYSASIQVKEFDGDTFTEVDSASFSIDVLTSDISITGIESPQQSCVGTDIGIEVSIENSGQCESEYRVTVDDVVLDKEDKNKSGVISANSSASLNFISALTSGLSESDSAQYDVVVEKRFNEDIDWQVVDTSDITVNLLKPNVTVQSTTYPDYDVPGDKKYEIEMVNDSQCDTQISINVAGSTQTKDVSAGSTTSVVDSVTLSDDELNRSLEVTDQVLNKTVIDDSFTVTPHKYISLDQSEGKATVVGGFEDEIPYSGNMIATAVSQSDNLEDIDTVLGRVGLYSFQGTMTSDSSDKDTIEFGALKAYNIRTSESVAILLDGEVKERGRRFNHSTVAASVLGLDSGEGDVNTITGPLSNFGTLTSTIGADLGVVSPIINKDR